MTKTILIDDEPLARLLVADYLREFPGVEIVAECNDGFEGLKAIQQYRPDLIFLDIQMPKINGFEMLELLDEPPAVIFTTAFDEYAIKAFDAHAIDYLLKPFTKERFNAALRKYLSLQDIALAQKRTEGLMKSMAGSPPQNQRIVVKAGNKIKIISLTDVLFLESADDYVKVVTREGEYLKNKTMNYYEMNLNSGQFVRTHRSYIVNVHEISRIDVYEKDSHIALLKNGRQIPVSKAGYSRLKEILGV